MDELFYSSFSNIYLLLGVRNYPSTYMISMQQNKQDLTHLLDGTDYYSVVRLALIPTLRRYVVRREYRKYLCILW